MMRIFGLFLALAVTAVQANAALLVSYPFTGGSAVGSVTDPEFIAGGNTASSFTAVTSGGAANAAGDWRTGTIAPNLAAKYDRFTVTAGGAGEGFATSQLKFTASRVSGTGQLTSGNVEYRIGTGAYVNIGQFSWASTGTFTLPFAVQVNPGQTLEVRFGYELLSIAGLFPATNNVVRLDDVQLSGSAVPEPASIAIFGSIAALGLVRRARRK